MWKEKRYNKKVEHMIMAQAKEHADFTDNKEEDNNAYKIWNLLGIPSFKCYLIKKIHTPKELWNSFFNHL